MKRIYLFAALLLISLNSIAVPLDYFFGKNTQLNPNVPSPEKFFNQEFGKWHLNHDQVISYIKTLAETSDRFELEKYGSTHQNRDLFILKISSPQNIGRLDEIRQEHKQLSNPNTPVNINEKTPFVYWLGYGVHGDEQSASNAAVLLAYYLAANESEELQNILKHSVILLEPCMNPDGFQRASLWSNMHRSKVPQPDLNNIQFHEMWPTGRYNHYWFDLNRDWLPLQQPESLARIDLYQKWKPNLLSDHHEMGTAGTFFFQPGAPSRNNHLTPNKNIDLTREIAESHAKILDDNGSLYFSEERFDDFYYGKGSSYPDANGSVGILFEMVKNRGEIMRNENGLIPFSQGLKNHFNASLSILKAGYEKRQELLEYQRWFYEQASVEAANDPVKAIVLADKGNPVKMHRLLSILQSHKIDIYSNSKEVEIDGNSIPENKAYVVPFSQAQYKLVKSIFEINKTFQDSIFYDVSAWNLPMAFNIPFKEITNPEVAKAIRGRMIEPVSFPKGEIVGGNSKVGFVIPASDNTIHKLLYALANKEIRSRVASKPFTIKTNSEYKKFSYGDIFIPVSYQKYGNDELYTILSQLAKENGVAIYSAVTALTPEGVDLGSRSLLPIKKPKILMLVGRGMKVSSAGEIRHLLDFKNHIPVTMFESHYFSKIKLFEYNTLILPEGTINLSAKDAARIKTWVTEGGTLIGLKSANKWLQTNNLISIKTKKYLKADSSYTIAYADRKKESGSKNIGGSIFMANIDVSHPLCYGYQSDQLPIFKNSRLAPADLNSVYNTPVKLTSQPLLCGYLKDENSTFLSNSPQIAISKQGRGRIISFYFNPNFRSFWQGTEKLFLNSIFYGDMIK